METSENNNISLYSEVKAKRNGTDLHIVLLDTGREQVKLCLILTQALYSLDCADKGSRFLFLGGEVRHKVKDEKRKSSI